MPTADHLGFAGVVLALVGIGITVLFPQARLVGIASLALAVIVLFLWVWVYFAGSPESCRSDWLELEGKFQSVHDAAPKPIPGVPWHGGNPHPRASWDGSRWRLEGEDAELKKRMQALCYDAGTLLLKSRKLRRTLDSSIRRESDPIVRWLKLVHSSQDFDQTLEGESRQPDGSLRQTTGGFINFLPDRSTRVARQCASRC